jgi:signal transduction histidine kinase
MIPAQPLPNEAERIKELLRYDILDTPEEQDFNDLVDLAAQVCGAEISLISLVDDHRQWFKACHGIDGTETPKDQAFCAHAIHGDDIMEVQNATHDERFFDNPFVTHGPEIRFYAGQPLFSASGYKFGTLCVIDRYPRQLTPVQRQALKILARQVERQLELRLKQRQMEASLALIEEQKRILETLNTLKNQTLAVLSHDLRSPLASLESILELFQNGLSADEVNTLMQQIHPELEQGVVHLNHVLQWADDQMRGTDVELHPCRIEEVAMASLSWVRQQAQRKGVDLVCELHTPQPVLGDAELLEIVLRNLLSNAIKFSRQGDRITIFATEQGAQMQIGIRDEGIGMTAAELEKISCVSTRFSKQGTAQEKGMGLGLLLCQSYLHHMNSQLSIVSEFQKGSEFSFTLDCIQGHADDQDTPRQDWSDCHCSAIFHTDPSRF